MADLNPNAIACMELLIPPDYSAEKTWRTTGYFRWRWYEDGTPLDQTMAYQHALEQLADFMPEKDCEDLMARVLEFKKVYFNRATQEVIAA